MTTHWEGGWVCFEGSARTACPSFWERIYFSCTSARQLQVLYQTMSGLLFGTLENSFDDRQVFAPGLLLYGP